MCVCVFKSQSPLLIIPSLVRHTNYRMHDWVDNLENFFFLIIISLFHHTYIVQLEGPVFTTPIHFDEDGAQVSSPADHRCTPRSCGENAWCFYCITIRASHATI